MGKPQIRSNPRTQAVFEDLEQYLDFCRDYGYRFNEADLYNEKSWMWQNFKKWVNWKNMKARNRGRK